LILIANTTYQTLVNSGKWLSTPPDDMALMMLMAKVDKLQCLVQRKEPVSGINKEKRKCFKCDKEGHWQEIVQKRNKMMTRKR